MTTGAVTYLLQTAVAGNVEADNLYDHNDDVGSDLNPVAEGAAHDATTTTTARAGAGAGAGAGAEAPRASRAARVAAMMALRKAELAEEQHRAELYAAQITNPEHEFSQLSVRSHAAHVVRTLVGAVDVALHVAEHEEGQGAANSANGVLRELLTPGLHRRLQEGALCPTVLAHDSSENAIVIWDADMRRRLVWHLARLAAASDTKLYGYIVRIDDPAACVVFSM